MTGVLDVCCFAGCPRQVDNGPAVAVAYDDPTDGPVEVLVRPCSEHRWAIGLGMVTGVVPVT